MTTESRNSAKMFQCTPAEGGCVPRSEAKRNQPQQPPTASRSEAFHALLPLRLLRLVLRTQPRSFDCGSATPRSFPGLAVCLVILFLLAHLAGWREHTSFLSGTAGAAGTDVQTSAFCGVVYILLYLGCVVVAPILVLAAGILALWRFK